MNTCKLTSPVSTAAPASCYNKKMKTVEHVVNSIQEINFLDGVTSTLAYKSHTVTVGSKTGGGNAFYVDGGETPVLIILPGAKYRFDVSDSTNTGHAFQFSENVSNLLVDRNFTKEEIFLLNDTINLVNPFSNNSCICFSLIITPQRLGLT